MSNNRSLESSLTYGAKYTSSFYTTVIKSWFRHAKINTGLILLLLVFSTLTTTGFRTQLSATAYSKAAPTPVGSLNDAEKAVIRIEVLVYSQSPGEDPFYGEGRGTGFLIDSNGLAVTANHVVAGAESLRVWVSGDPRPHSAQVIALSECADLALIDVAGNGYPFLAWSSLTGKLGTKVFAAGIPERAIEVSEGIIEEVISGTAKISSTPGYSSLIHNAGILPGFSGGPLLDQRGRVVGVNLRGNEANSEAVAITQSEVQSFLDRTRNSLAIESLGIDGAVWQNGINTGLWIERVQPDSAADLVGLTPGDILTELDGKPVGTNGSLAGYCQSLNNWKPTDSMSFEAIRSQPKTMITGTFNPVQVLTESIKRQSIFEDTFSLVETQYAQMMVPVGWSIQVSSDIDTETLEEIELYSVESTSNDLAFIAGLAIIPFSGQLDADNYLDSVDMTSELCERTKRDQHNHAVGGVSYSGKFDTWYCSDTEAYAYVLVLQPDNLDVAATLHFFSLTEEEDRAYDTLRYSLSLLPSGGERRDIRPTAMIIADSLNVRTGPGTNYIRIETVAKNQVLSVIGRNTGCSWLKVVTPTNEDGWISASASLVQFNGNCDEIPESSFQNSQSQPIGQSQMPSSQATSPTQAESSGRSCLLFQNFIGTEVVVTLTAQDRQWNTTITLPKGTEQYECLDPGRYTYTLDAPPPWGSTNGGITLNPGDNFSIPIQSR